MNDYEGRIISKLPNQETSIFAVMSKLAVEHNAINLSQGFPDFEVSKQLIGMIYKNMLAGHNQYAPMPGIPKLRDNIRRKIEMTYGIYYDPETEITVTAGATQAIYSVIASMIKDDDEAIIFDPAYDSYSPSVRINGGMVKHSILKQPDFSIDWEELPRQITHRTKMIIINSPHNPTGAILKAEDMEKLEALTRNTDIVILADEVYEHLVYDGNEHESICKYPELASRSFVIGSFGKTFHATGWKMGYALAPKRLMDEFRKAHQFVVFACNTPVQMAIADFLEDPKNFQNLHTFYQEKRDYFLKSIKKSRFKPIPSLGTYFQLLDYSDISDEHDMDFAVRLIKEHGVASVPISPFYKNDPGVKLLRFCFAKKNETMDQAAKILCKI